MILLGIKIGDHDYNFSLSDGRKVYYHKTERQLQIKHHGSTDPLLWIPVIKNWGYSPKDIDAICVTSDEELFRETLDPSIHYHLIKSEYWFPGVTCPVYRLDHHLAHSLSIWPVSNQTPSVSFVFDGDGDFGRSFSVFRNLELVHSEVVCDVPSFGFLLENLASKYNVLGSKLDLSGKMMGLKSYGNVNTDYKELIDIFSLTDISKAADFRLWESITQKTFNENKLDYLATIHDFAENKFPEYFLKFANPEDCISFTGGVAQNSVLNSKIQKVFKNCIIPPHASDDGLSLGCIEFLRKLFDLEEFSREGFPFWQNDPCPEEPSDVTIKKAAEFLAQGKIVAWHQGRGEVGPRALGNRSILMDPRIKNGKDLINLVKNRENFRPFGASVLKDSAEEYFNISYESPYMLHVVDVKDTSISSVTHIDRTCRVQTVSNENSHYFRLIDEFKKLTGCPLLLNTSLNNNGKPISSTEKDSLEFFKNSKLDVIYFGNRMYKK